VTLFIASILAGKYQTRFSRSLTIKIGVFLHAVACGCFIGLDYCDDKNIFLAIGFAGRILEGIGAGMVQTGGKENL
jgi:MFS family permease